MRLFDDQVHVLEILALIVASFFAYAMGYSLPFFSALFLMIWPLFLLQLLLQGVLELIWRGIRAVYHRLRPPKPKRPKPVFVPRTGVARYLWLLPLVAMTLGYGKYVLETGRWFI